MTKENIRFFEVAKKKAGLSDFDRIHMGCVATYKGKIIASGYNIQKTHPKQMFYNIYRDGLSANPKLKHYLHAEMMCLNKIDASIPMEKVDLYIYRKRKDQPCGLARPCNACMQRIKDMGIKNIYYSTDMGYAHEVII